MRIFLTLAFLVVPSVAYGQTATGEVVPELNPVISGPRDIAVGRTLVLDASSTTGLGEETAYRWYRDDVPYPISRSVELVYTPEETGLSTIRLLISTIVDDERIEVEKKHTVIVYDRKILLIADTDTDPKKLNVHQQTAADAGVYLRIVQPPGPVLPVALEEALFAALTEESDALTGVESVVLWSESIAGLQALMRVKDALPEKFQALTEKPIIVLTDDSLQTVARTTQGPFSVLEPSEIIITRKEALNPLIEDADLVIFKQMIEQRDIGYLVVDATTSKVRPWNLFSALINLMLKEGIPSNVVILLLMLPVIAMIIAFLKQVIGITTFGLFGPSIVALSFLALGWKVGLLFLIFILITGYATRSLMRTFRLLYIPKVAIILTVVSISMLVLIAVSAQLGITFSRDTVFVLLIMSTLSESFLNLKREEGWLSALIGFSETILAALLCVFIVQWPWLQSLILAYPELIFLTILFNFGLGKWTGLRLVEYFRFREVFRHLQEE